MKPNVLVVDDEPGALMLLGIMLEHGGFSVIKATHPSQALERLNHITPDLILIDVQQPEMDAIELCRMIRRCEATKKTPVLIVSVHPEAYYWLLSLEAGADDYLHKPIEYRTLIEMVRLHCAQRIDAS